MIEDKGLLVSAAEILTVEARYVLPSSHSSSPDEKVKAADGRHNTVLNTSMVLQSLPALFLDIILTRL